MWSRYTLGTTPATLPFTSVVMDFVAEREKRRSLYLQARKPSEFHFGEEHIIPRLITVPPLQQARRVVLSGEENTFSRLLTDLAKLVDCEMFTEVPVDQIELLICPRCPVPSWLPFHASEQGSYGYCSCQSCKADMLVVSPYHRARDPCTLSQVCPIQSSLGFWIVDKTRAPTRVRRPGDVWVGAFLDQCSFEAGWWDSFCQFFNDLHMDDMRIRAALDNQVGWCRVEPELMCYIKHLAATQGNQVMRRDLVNIQTRYSAGYLSRNGVSVGLAVALAARITSHAILAGQGDSSECYRWTFLCLGSPKSHKSFIFPLGPSLIPKKEVIEPLKEIVAVPEPVVIPPEPEDQEDEEVTIVLVTEDEVSDEDEPMPDSQESADTSHSEDDDPASFDPFNLNQRLHEYREAFVEEEEVPTFIRDARGMWVLKDTALDDSYDDGWSGVSDGNYCPSSPSYYTPTPEISSPASSCYDPCEVIPCPTSPTGFIKSKSASPDLGETPGPQGFLPRLTASERPFGWSPAADPFGDMPPPLPPRPNNTFVATPPSTPAAPKTPKRPLPLPKREGSGKRKSDDVEELAYAMDELVNFREKNEYSWEYEDEKMSFRPREPRFVPASTTWLGEHSVEPDNLDTIIKRSNKPFVPEKRSGYIAGVTFGQDPIVFESSTSSMKRCLNGRTAKNLPKAVNRVSEFFQGQKIEFHRIGNKALFWPKTMKCDAYSKFMSRDLIELAEDKNELQELAKRMKSGSYKRAIKVMEDITGGLVEWDQETQLIKVFIKSDDKVAKDKPRLIQFVPTIVWVRTILKIENIMGKIKDPERVGGQNWAWEDSFASWTDKNGVKRHKTFIWTSGMTQKQLFNAVNSYLDKGEGELVFICGDDNTDSEGDADAGSYDASQRGVFFNLQCAVLERMGFVKDEIDMIFELHGKLRSGAGMQASLSDIMLPSGAPWTLFLNTIGLVVFHRQVAAVLSKAPIPYARAVDVAARLLGLNMDFLPAPRTDGDFFSGSEFLKHIFVPLTFLDKGRKTKKLFPVQLPSRVFKWGCMNVRSDRATRPDMRKHIGGVALGQRNFLMEPFVTGAFVENWAQYGREKHVPNWANITCPKLSDALTLPEGVSWKQWEDACAEVLVNRYNTSRKELEKCREMIGSTSQMGDFRGGLFARMVARDYAGAYKPF